MALSTGPLMMEATNLPFKTSIDTSVREHKLIYCTRGSIPEWLTSCFTCFGFSCFAHVELTTYLLVWSNPNQSDRGSAIQWYFPLQSKWVFYDCVNLINTYECVPDNKKYAFYHVLPKFFTFLRIYQKNWGPKTSWMSQMVNFFSPKIVFLQTKKSPNKSFCVNHDNFVTCHHWPTTPFRSLPSVWPEENHKMSLKVAQKWFH